MAALGPKSNHAPVWPRLLESADASASAGISLRLEFVYGYNCVGQARCAFSVRSREKSKGVGTVDKQ